MQQVVKLVTQSPSRKENHNAAHNDKLHSVMVEGILSPNSNYLTDSFGNFYERKRRREDTIPGNSALLDEISRIRRSPKHHRSEVVSESFSEQPSESSTETSTVGRDGEARVQHWADVCIFAFFMFLISFSLPDGSDSELLTFLLLILAKFN